MQDEVTTTNNLYSKSFPEKYHRECSTLLTSRKLKDKDGNLSKPVAWGKTSTQISNDQSCTARLCDMQ